jgi:alpha-N-arabinofuranosidase
MISNPVIPGFHPDPSICRVGKDYYLVNSSFEYFPGVPLSHSRDLVHWRQIGHCLARESQLPLHKAPSSGGIYAPTIRFHNGTFYMVTTNVSAGGHFFVTAKDPAGPWSDPVWIDQEGIDPSLFFDDDGTVYFTSTGGEDPQGYIHQSTLDPQTGRLLTAPRPIWEGTGGQYPEAPHLYTINGTYYLLIAEGGTDYGHMVTIARADSPWGPFDPCPRNPVFTHRSTSSPIQCTGHGDLVEAHDGSWWFVFLGTRPNYMWHHLGRETFLAPVTWDDDGWPVIGDNGMITPETAAETLPPHPWPTTPSRDDFDEPELACCWNFVRNPDPAAWSLAGRPGWLTLHGTPVTLSEVGAPAFVGRRQECFQCRARTLLCFGPQASHEEAGLAARMNEEHHAEILVTVRDGQPAVVFRQRIGPLEQERASERLTNDTVELWIQADRETYAFGWTDQNGSEHELGRTPTRYFSKEVAGGFTGVYFGMYATGNGKPCTSPARFDWFDLSDPKSEATDLH